MSDVNNKKTEVVYVFAPYGDENVEIMRQCESSTFDRNSKAWKIDKARLGEANPAIKNFVMFDNYSDTMKYHNALIQKDEKKQEEIKKNSLQNTNEDLFATIGKVFDAVKAEKLASDRKQASEDYKNQHSKDIVVNFILPKKEVIGEEKYEEYKKAFQSSQMRHLNNNANHIYQCDQNLLPYIHPVLKELPMYDTANVLLATANKEKNVQKAKPVTLENLGIKEEIGSKYNVQAGEKRYEQKKERNEKIQKFKEVKKQKFVDRMQRVYVKYSDYTKQVISGLRSKFKDPTDDKKDFANIHYDKVSKCTIVPKRVLKDCPTEIREAFLHCTVYGNKVDAIEHKNPLNKLSKQWLSETSDLRASVTEDYGNKYKEQQDNCKEGEKPTITLLDVYADAIKLENAQNEDKTANLVDLLDPTDVDEIGNISEEETQAMVDFINQQGELEEERGLSEDDLDFTEEEEQGMSR